MACQTSRMPQEQDQQKNSLTPKASQALKTSRKCQSMNFLNMIKNHNSINGQTVILGDFYQKKVQALIYWDRYKKRRGMAIVAADWTNAQMADAIERVKSDVP